MKNFFYGIRSAKNVIRVGFICHAISAYAIPLSFVFIYLICLGSKPSDACGDFILVLIIPCIVIAICSFIVALAISLMTLDGFLLVLSVVGTIILGTYLWHRSTHYEFLRLFFIYSGYFAYCISALIFPIFYWKKKR